MADRKHGIPAPATTSTVRSADWDGRDLSGERHEKVAFIDVDLSETVDDGGVFTECAFRGARFNVSTHADAAFVNCTFTRCSFFDASFAGCKLVGSMFDGCTFGLLEVDGGDWSFTDLSAFDPETAELKGAVIDPAQALVIAAALGLVVRED